MEGTSRVRAALAVETAVPSMPRAKKISRISGYSRIAQDTGIASSSEELLKDLPGPARAIKELQEPGVKSHPPFSDTRFKGRTLRSLSFSKYNYHPRTCGTGSPFRKVKFTT